MNDAIKRVTEFARSWKNKSIRSVPGCPGETCAFFVRYVFRTVLHQAGVMPIAHSRPYYRENHIQALPTNENFADGLAGDSVGLRIPKSQVQPGDILLFKDTYFSRDFPVGSITHVGIALDSNGLMADSSGGMCHVRNHFSTFPNCLVEVRRRFFGVGTTGTGLTLNHGQLKKIGNFKEIEISYISGAPRVLLDNSVQSYQFISVDIADADSGLHHKLFSHHGLASAFLSGYPVQHLEVVAKLQSGLHVWVNGKEMKPSSVHIGVS